MADCGFRCHQQVDDRHDICLVDWLRWRHRSGLDTVFHIVGPEGAGKSGLGFTILKRYDPRFSIKSSLVYTHKDMDRVLQGVLEKLGISSFTPEQMPLVREQLGQMRPVAWLDEATNLFDAMDFAKTESKNLQKIFRQWRFLRFLVVLIDPDGRLQKYVTQHRAVVKCVVDRVGHCIVKRLHIDYNQESPEPKYVRAFGWYYNDPKLVWPEEWNLYEYEKINRMDLQLKTLSRSTVEKIDNPYSRRRGEPNKWPPLDPAPAAV